MTRKGRPRGGAGRRTGQSGAVHLRRLIEEALVVGEEVEVRGFDWAGAPHEIVALCRRKGRTHRVNVTALQWAAGRPAGAEWFDAYRAWLKGAW